jgi:hypothetical protein
VLTLSTNGVLRNLSHVDGWYDAVNVYVCVRACVRACVCARACVHAECDQDFEEVFGSICLLPWKVG